MKGEKRQRDELAETRREKAQGVFGSVQVLQGRHRSERVRQTRQPIDVHVQAPQALVSLLVSVRNPLLDGGRLLPPQGGLLGLELIAQELLLDAVLRTKLLLGLDLLVQPFLRLDRLDLRDALICRRSVALLAFLLVPAQSRLASNVHDALPQPVIGRPQHCLLSAHLRLQHPPVAAPSAFDEADAARFQLVFDFCDLEIQLLEAAVADLPSFLLVSLGEEPFPFFVLDVDAQRAEHLAELDGADLAALVEVEDLEAFEGGENVVAQRQQVVHHHGDLEVRHAQRPRAVQVVEAEELLGAGLEHQDVQAVQSALELDEGKRFILGFVQVAPRLLGVARVEAQAAQPVLAAGAEAPDPRNLVLVQRDSQAHIRLRKRAALVRKPGESVDDRLLGERRLRFRLDDHAAYEGVQLRNAPERLEEVASGLRSADAAVGVLTEQQSISGLFDVRHSGLRPLLREIHEEPGPGSSHSLAGLRAEVATFVFSPVRSAIGLARIETDVSEGQPEQFAQLLHLHFATHVGRRHAPITFGQHAMLPSGPQATSFLRALVRQDRQHFVFIHTIITTNVRRRVRLRVVLKEARGRGAQIDRFVLLRH
eukprot:scaffold1764_cov236-Pinguiococcus_pyrenoidosus.AAC.1